MSQMAREVGLFDVPEIAFTESDEMPEPQESGDSNTVSTRVDWQTGGSGLEVFETDAGIEDVLRNAMENVSMGDGKHELTTMLDCVRRMMEFTKSKGATLGDFVPEIFLIRDEDKDKPYVKNLFNRHSFTLVDKGNEKVWALIIPGSSKHSDLKFLGNIINKSKKPIYRVERATEKENGWFVDKEYCDMSYYLDCVLVCCKSMIDIIDSTGPVYCFGPNTKELDTGRPKSFIVRLDDTKSSSNIRLLNDITKTLRFVNSFSVRSIQSNELHRRVALFSPRNKLICKNYIGPFVTIAMHGSGFEEEINFLEREEIKLVENLMTKPSSIGKSRCYIFCAKKNFKDEYYKNLKKLYTDLRGSQDIKFTHEPSGCFDKYFVF